MNSFVSDSPVSNDQANHLSDNHFQSKRQSAEHKRHVYTYPKDVLYMMSQMSI